MKLVNPVGRSVATGSNAEIAPRACMCSYNFASARGTGDHCFHCGFNCDSDYYRAANEHAAYWTIRAS